MRIAYAYRRSNLYPYRGAATSFPSGDARTRFLRRVSDIGFDGLELSLDALGSLNATEAEISELRRELEDHGTPCAVVKGGGGLHDYRVAISAMADAGFDGYLAVEGATQGDQLYADRRSFEYVKSVLAEIEEGAEAIAGS